MPRRAIWIAIFVVAVLAAGAGLAGNQFEARKRLHDNVRALTGGGEVEAGRQAIAGHGCGGCHQIPGVQGARGKVGPSLKGFAARPYIAGRVTNAPEPLIQWVFNPYAIDPKTAMPPSGLTPDEARDVAAYLYTLR